jgi:myo-inositol-1-phosphate synthase
MWYAGNGIGGSNPPLSAKIENRLASKRLSKTNAVTSILREKEFGVRIGSSDYISHLNDNKICYINVNGQGFY